MESDDEFVILLGKNIKRLRLSKGLTQFDLACLCGIERQNMVRIENGRTNISVKMLNKIAKSLGLPPRDLLVFAG